MANTQGADIPEDLFDIILDFMVVKGDPGVARSSYVPIRKSELGRVALVCRRWARTCQEKIFERIMIWSRHDFLSLWSFVERPDSVIPRSLVRLVLAPDVMSAPWIHLVCQKLPSRMLHPEFGMLVRLEGDHAAPPVLGKSIHRALPCQPLPMFSFGLQGVDLTDVRFNRLEDLARLAGAMPSLRELSCIGVVWPLRDRLPYLTSFVARRSRNSVRYFMDGCTDDAAVVLLSSQIVPRGQHHLCSGDVGTIYRLTRAVSRHGIFESEWIRGDDGSGVLIVNSFDVSLSFVLAPDDLLPVLRITGITIFFKLMPEPITAQLGRSWRSFDLLVFSLRMDLLRWVALGFGSLDDVKAFASEIARTDLPYLSSMGKIRYAIWNREYHMQSQLLAVNPETRKEDLNNVPRQNLRKHELHLLYD